jgi:hypothetical protein
MEAGTGEDGGAMGVNPTRFAIAVSASLACLMLGLLVGVSAGGSHTAHVFRTQTVTASARPLQAAARTVTVAGRAPERVSAASRRSDAVARTVTTTVVRTVTVPVTVPAAPAAPAAATPGKGPGDGHGDGHHGDGHHGDGGGP